MAPLTVAIMQPYFLPYLGYFRLFAASDLFVIYDCVQFPRRGWVHRNRLPDVSGTERWLTLPLERAPREALIRDLRFPADVSEIFAGRLRPFRLTAKEPGHAEPVIVALRDIGGSPVGYIEQLLESVAGYLELPRKIIRSTTLDVPSTYRGQDRILEIASRLGARRYVNAPGGRSLYDAAAFEAAGIELTFLPDYAGPTASILWRILHEKREDLAREVLATAGAEK